MNQIDTIQMDLPAAHKYLSVLSVCIAEILAKVEGLAGKTTTVYNIQLAVHETCTNIVNHAYEGQPAGRIRITITFASHPSVLTVELSDTGTPFQISDVAEPDLAEPQIHGYGLFLIRRLMDEVTYDSYQGANVWRLTKYLEMNS